MCVLINEIKWNIKILRVGKKRLKKYPFYNKVSHKYTFFLQLKRKAEIHRNKQKWKEKKMNSTLKRKKTQKFQCVVDWNKQSSNSTAAMATKTNKIVIYILDLRDVLLYIVYSNRAMYPLSQSILCEHVFFSFTIFSLYKIFSDFERKWTLHGWNETVFSSYFEINSSKNYCVKKLKKIDWKLI